MIDLLQRLSTIEHIPSYPQSKKIIQETLETKNLEEVANAIIFDPSLTIEFLKIANADSYGYKKKIANIKHALLILDNELIELIISQHPVIPELAEFNESVREEYRKLLRHSLEVRVIIQLLFDRIFTEKQPQADLKEDILTASIIHDIGLFYLLIYFPDRYTTIHNKMKQNHYFQKKEESLVLPDHSLIGSIICEYWNLPNSIKTAIAFHHLPWSGQNNFGSEILYLANSISCTFYDYYFDNRDIYSIDEQIIMQPKLLEIIMKSNIDIAEIAQIQSLAAQECEKLNLKMSL